MQTLVKAACLAAVMAVPSAAGAQTAVSLGDPNPPAWDASGHVSWLSVDKSGLAPDWNRWYDAATFGGAMGRFFGPHLKVEFDAATSASAEVYVERTVTVPGERYPVYVTQPQRFRMSTFSAGASYQFLDNRWFHPVIGGGLEAGRESRVIERQFYGPQLPVMPPIEAPGTRVTWRGLPFAQVGFKWFVGERAFIRSDVRTTFDAAGVDHVSWRSGVGFEF